MAAQSARLLHTARHRLKPMLTHTAAVADALSVAVFALGEYADRLVPVAYVGAPPPRVPAGVLRRPPGIVSGGTWAVPFTSNEGLAGAAVVTLPLGSVPSRHERELVHSVGVLAAEMADNALLRERGLARTRTFEALASLGTLITGATSVAEVLEQVVGYGTILLAVPAFALVLIEPDGSLRLAASDGLPETATWPAAAEGERDGAEPDARVVGIVEGYGPAGVSPSLARAGFTHAAVAPLHVESTLRGYLVGLYGAGRAPDDETVWALKLYAAYASTALHNAERFQAEQEIADTLQASFVTLPENIEGVDFGYFYRSATVSAKVGGDFFDVFEMDIDRVLVCIGDISGKGIHAAALTAVVRSTVRSCALHERRPAALMSEVNTSLSRNTPEGAFATMFLGVLRRSTGRFEYCNGAHPRPIVRRTDGRLELLEARCPLVGAYEKVAYHEASIDLRPGDRIVAYTDGVVEARSAGSPRKFFGEKRVVESLAGCADVPIDRLPQVIFGDVSDFCRGALRDDLAIFALEWAGPVARVDRRVSADMTPGTFVVRG